MNTKAKIKSLKIKNFRGIKEFELKDLGKINIFVGRNSVGKSTILESLFLITGLGEAVNLYRLGILRKAQFNNSSDFSIPFYERDINNKIKITFEIEKEKINLEINPIFNSPQIGEKNIVKIPNNNQTEEFSNQQKIKGYVYSFQINKNKYSSIFCVDNNGDLVGQSAKNYKQIYSSQMFAAEINTASIQKMILDNKKHELIQVMKKIVLNIETMEDISGVIHINIGAGKKLIPINYMGDGLIKIVNIFAVINTMENNFVIIDEVENGLHYKSQKFLWQIIAEQSLEKNVDCFISSHSKEMMQELNKFLKEEENAKYRDLFKIHTLFLSKKTGILKSSSYDYKKFTSSIDRGIEFRGFH